MHDCSILVSNYESSAQRDGRKLIEEVEEEHFLKWDSQKCCHCINLSNEVLVFELVASIPFKTIEEAFWDGEYIDEFCKALDRFFIVPHYGSPPD